jgi:rare lipoprotein A
MIIVRCICIAFAILTLSIFFGSNAFAEKQAFSGLASYYSYKGGQAASGQEYKAQAFTAAHRTLPFGTRVRVTNAKNGKSVIVTINDRGPFKRGRVIDVSLSAARALDMLDRGVIYVRAETL